MIFIVAVSKANCYYLFIPPIMIFIIQYIYVLVKNIFKIPLLFKKYKQRWTDPVLPNRVWVAETKMCELQGGGLTQVANLKCSISPSFTR